MPTPNRQCQGASITRRQDVGSRGCSDWPVGASDGIMLKDYYPPTRSQSRVESRTMDDAWAFFCGNLSLASRCDRLNLVTFADAQSPSL